MGEEYYSMQNEIQRLRVESKRYENMPSPQDILKLIEIASEMRNVLEECRTQQLNYKIAKKIDDVLSRASDLD